MTKTTKQVNPYARKTATVPNGSKNKGLHWEISCASPHLATKARTIGFDKHATEDSSAELSKSVVDPLQEPLCRGSKFRVCVVSDKGTTGSPNCSMSDA